MCSIYNLKGKDGNVKVMRELAAHTGRTTCSMEIKSLEAADALTLERVGFLFVHLDCLEVAHMVFLWLPRLPVLLSFPQ